MNTSSIACHLGYQSNLQRFYRHSMQQHRVKGQNPIIQSCQTILNEFLNWYGQSRVHDPFKGSTGIAPELEVSQFSKSYLLLNTHFNNRGSYAMAAPLSLKYSCN